MEHNLLPAHAPELRGRIPYKMIVTDDGRLLFKWIYIGTKKFSEPFFDDSISFCLSLPQNSKMPLTDAAALIQFASSLQSVKPSAFIFHISRCGSTLLTQLLSIDERSIVLSEVPLLDDLLRIPFSHKEKNIPDQGKIFCAVLSILAEKRSGNEKYLFVKTDSWHLMFFERIRKLFPAVPALLLYRSPAEVIRSQQKLRGMHAVQGLLEPAIFDFTEEKINELFPDDYLELVLEKYFQKCLDILHTDHHAKAISYHDGPMEMLRNSIDFSNISVSPELLIEMEKRTKQHSKYPENKFDAEPVISKTEVKTNSENLFEKLNQAVKKRTIKTEIKN